MLVLEREEDDCECECKCELVAAEDDDEEEEVYLVWGFSGGPEVPDEAEPIPLLIKEH